MSEQWPEVHVETSAEGVDAIEQWLFEAGALSVTLQDRLNDGDLSHAVLEPVPGEVRLWESLRITGLFAQDTPSDQVQSALHIAASICELAVPDYRIVGLADEVWELSWMRDFVPMQFGDTFWICPSYAEPVDPHAINLKLDPGLAFGSGTHPTTAQCLEWLARQSFKQERVIDFGCGSGVLAIAAGLLGARDILAIDIDPQALDATRQNAVTNGVGKHIRTGQPDLLESSEDVCDIMLANILFRPLMSLAETFSRLTVTGGKLVLSGLLDDQVQELCLRYNPWFEFVEKSASENWALLVAHRR